MEHAKPASLITMSAKRATWPRIVISQGLNAYAKTAITISPPQGSSLVPSAPLCSLSATCAPTAQSASNAIQITTRWSRVARPNARPAVSIARPVMAHRLTARPATLSHISVSYRAPLVSAWQGMSVWEAVCRVCPVIDSMMAVPIVPTKLGAIPVILATTSRH